MQGEMLPASAARVFSCSQIFLRIVNMLDLEQKARAVRLKFCRNLLLSRSPTETPKLIYTPQIVQGRIVITTIVLRCGYLNFS